MKNHDGRPASKVHLMQQTNMSKTATDRNKGNSTNKAVKLNTWAVTSRYEPEKYEQQ
jgi:hypothetical protein